MKTLCVTRIAELKEFEEPESDSWAFPWVSVPNFTNQRNNPTRQKLLQFLESESDTCERFLFDYKEDAETFLMVRSSGRVIILCSSLV
jgi:hypothetical protein